jgi:GDP-L-fucose synthase
MRLLVTGANGMVGRNIVQHLLAESHEILVPSSQELDLCDYAAVKDYLKAHRPDCIVHAAGRVGGIQANIREPVAFLVDNLDLGRNIVMAAKASQVTRLINLGSSCMYPRNAPNPLTEDMILQGELEPTNEGYALAKIMTARLCQYIRREDPALLYKTLVPCNIYGTHDKFDPVHSHMVPAGIHKIHLATQSGADEVEIWGDGTARREFMYAGDLADCVFRAIRELESMPDVMNVGVGEDHAVNDYYAVIAEIVGYRGRFVHDLSKPVGMARKLVSTARAEAWGWRATTPLAEGIKKTYEFYLEHYKNAA